MPTIDDLRTAVLDLSSLAAADLRRLWREAGDDPRLVQQALADVLPALAQTYGLAAGAVAADWYDELRDEQNIDGRFFAITADLGDLGTDELAGFAVGPLYGAEPDLGRTRTIVEGGLQRRVTNVARDTVMGSSIEDPRAQGWQRSAGPSACAFCRMLEGRGAVYSRAGVDFGAHDHCDCVAVPAWGGRELPVKPYTPTSRNITDADRARTRKWMRENLPDVRG